MSDRPAVPVPGPVNFKVELATGTELQVEVPPHDDSAAAPPARPAPTPALRRRATDAARRRRRARALGRRVSESSIRVPLASSEPWQPAARPVAGSNLRPYRREPYPAGLRAVAGAAQQPQARGAACPAGSSNRRLTILVLGLALAPGTPSMPS
jgi:hypothetical protein